MAETTLSPSFAADQNQSTMKKIMFFAVLIALLSFFQAASMHAQTSVVRGTVADKLTDLPLQDVNVLLYNDAQTFFAITDARGRFAFDTLQPGRYFLDASMIGFLALNGQEVVLHAGKETVLDIRLEESAYTLKEVSVTAYKNKYNPTNELAAVSARSFNAEDTRRFAGSLNDPSRMVSNFAGVSGANDARNDIIIRGNSPSGLLWRLECVDIPNPNHFGAFGSTGGPVSMLNNNLLGASDFLTGAFPAEYGNALAGSFDISLRKGNTETPEFMGQIGFNGLELGAEGPLGKGGNASYLINYRYSTIAFFELLGMGGFTGTGAAIPYYQDLSFKLHWKTEKAGTFELFGLGGLSNIDLAANLDDPNDLYAQTGRDTYFASRAAVTGLKHDLNLKNGWQLRNILSFNRFGQNTQVDSIVANTEDRVLFFGDYLIEDRYQLHSRLQKKFNARNFLRMGLIANHIDFNMQDSVLQGDIYRPLRSSDGNTQQLQAYAQYQYKFSDRLVASAGVHGMYLLLNDHISVEPRATLQYFPADRHSLSAAYGRHSQAQNMLIYFYTDDQGGLPNQELDFSKADHFVLAYTYNPAPAWTIKTELYHQRLSNIPVEREASSFSMLNAGADFGIPAIGNLQNAGTGTNTGAELTVERRFARGYYLMGTLSVFDSKYRGSDDIERNTAFNGNYVSNLLGGYEFKLGDKNVLAFDLRNSLAGGRRVTPIDLEASRLEGREVLQHDRAFEERLPDYYRLDLRITLRLNGKRIMQEWFVDLQNLTNRQNPFIRTFSPQTGDVFTTYQLGFVPMFNYRILF